LRISNRLTLPLFNPTNKNDPDASSVETEELLFSKENATLRETMFHLFTDPSKPAENKVPAESRAREFTTSE
jgi:hypothetical protein